MAIFGRVTRHRKNKGILAYCFTVSDLLLAYCFTVIFWNRKISRFSEEDKFT